MNIYGHIIDLKKLGIAFARLTLCLFVLSSSFHLAEHNHSVEDGFNMCKVDCESCEPHARYDNCEECVVNRNQETFAINSTYFNYLNNKPIFFSIENKVFNRYSISLFSYSRPPPPLDTIQAV